jgi:TRAP-type C4-dicarboxylate transport system substrate-binding protein
MSDDPIVGLKDLKGKKVWTPEHDVISRTALESLEISPIPLPLSDVLIGLQTGMIDTVAASPVGAIALQWHTSISYVTDVPLLYLYGTLIIKESALKTLSASDRAILLEVMKSVFQKLNQQDRINNQAARRALENQGIKIVKPSPQQLDHLHKSVGSVTRRLQEEGVIGAEVLQIQQKHLTEFRGRLGSRSDPDFHRQVR